MTRYPPAPDHFDPQEMEFVEFAERVFLEAQPNSPAVGEKLTRGSYEDFRLRLLDLINRVRLEELEAMGFEKVAKGTGRPPEGSTGWFIDIGTPGYNSDRDLIHITPFNMSEEVQTSISILCAQLVRNALAGSLRDTLDVTAFRDHPAKFDTQDKIETERNKSESSRIDEDLINLQNFRAYHANPLNPQDHGLKAYQKYVEEQLHSPYATGAQSASFREVENLMIAIHEGIREQLFKEHPELREALEKNPNFEQAYAEYINAHPDQFQLARDSYIEPRLMALSKEMDQCTEQIKKLTLDLYSPKNQNKRPIQQQIEMLELMKKRNGTLIASFYEESFYTCGAYNVVLRYKGGQSTQRKVEKLHAEQRRRSSFKPEPINLSQLVLEDKEASEPVPNDLLASMRENLIFYNEHFTNGNKESWDKLLIDKSKYSERVLNAAIKLCDMLNDKLSLEGLSSPKMLLSPRSEFSTTKRGDRQKIAHLYGQA